MANSPHLLPLDWPQYTQEDIASVAEMVRSGAVFDSSGGGVVGSLEETFRNVHGAAYALALNSGTSALFAAFVASGIRPGDEVLCPAHTYFATVTPLVALGAKPVFCDVQESTGNLCPTDAASRVTPRTTAMVVTHLWGHPVDVTALVSIARQYSLLLIEDCSHAHSATYRGTPVGTFGDASAFSVGSRKIVSGGNGGLLLTNRVEVYERALLLCQPKRAATVLRRSEYADLASTCLGYNFRIDPIAARLALGHLRRLPELVATKASQLRAIELGLVGQEGIRWHSTAGDVTRGGWHGFPIVLEEPLLSRTTRDTFLASLRANGVPARPPDEIPLYRRALFSQPRLDRGSCFSDLRSSLLSSVGTCLPVAERLAADSVLLPVSHLNLPAPEFVTHIVETIRAICNQAMRS